MHTAWIIVLTLTVLFFVLPILVYVISKVQMSAWLRALYDFHKQEEKPDEKE